MLEFTIEPSGRINSCCHAQRIASEHIFYNAQLPRLHIIYTTRYDEVRGPSLGALDVRCSCSSRTCLSS